MILQGAAMTIFSSAQQNFLRSLGHEAFIQIILGHGPI